MEDLVRTLEERVAERTNDLLNARNELRELSARLLKAQDEERRRIARELHDGVGQLLAALNMNLSILLSDEARVSAEAAKAIHQSLSLVDQASREIRVMSHLLHPPLLDEVGLESALQCYVDGFAERSKIDVRLDLEPDLETLPQDLKLPLFRIVQECLTNIHRHSGSGTARVRLYRVSGEVRLEVEDQGKGISPHLLAKISSGGGTGLGLRGIRERLRQLGGRLELRSGDSGTIILAVLPLDPNEASETGANGVPERDSEAAVLENSRTLEDSPATVLCIDDERTGLLPRKLLLESEGHRVIEARSGVEGIRLFQAEQIDLVILDYWMSGMKGTAVAAELKRLDPSVPIVMLSGLPELPGEAMGIVDEWLLKGSSRAEELLETVRALLERRTA